jgi:urease accessory protein
MTTLLDPSPIVADITSNVPASLSQKAIKNQWFASLELGFDRADYGTRLSAVKRLGPLSVQKAFYPEGPDCAHVYLLHPPAGIVSGDELLLSVRVQDKAHALLTTPGANRFYRARDDVSIGDPTQTQSIELHIASQAKLEYFPLETLGYEGADGVSQLDVYLGDDSVYLGWDIVCLGLPASGQPFVEGRFTLRNRVFCQGKLLYHDTIAINPQNGLFQSLAGLGAQPVFGSFLIYAPESLMTIKARSDLLRDFRQQLIRLKAEHLVSITDIDGLLVARYLGEHCEQCKALFIELWRLARPLVCDKPVKQPRIWFT